MKSLIYGNGESRQVWDITKKYEGFTTWGCNAIYRDAVVDNLVAIDYGVQQEIYQSGYATENICHFADWSILEDFDPEFLKMNYTPMDIHETDKGDITSCVVQGKERETAEKNYEEMMNQFPHLDKEDCKNKCYTNVGLYVTWLKEKDKVNNIEFPINWCAGATAMYLSCKEGAKEIYMLGFDLSEYDEPINNIYKGTKNYLSETSRGFNTDNWTTQLIQIFKDFPETKFYWVVKEDASPLVCNNVKSITYKTLDKICEYLI